MQLRSYQQEARRFSLRQLLRPGPQGAALLLGMGLGKTATSLFIIDDLKAYGEIKKVLIVAPLRVVYSVWQQEIANWGLNLSSTIIHGRKKDDLIHEDTDIHLINVDGVRWLKDKKPKYDMIVIDEGSKFKSWSSGRSKALRKILPPKRILLTGTPTPNCLSDLFSQMYLVDGGRSLGTTIGRFRAKYMKQGGFENREWLMRPEMVPDLYEAIKPVCLHMKVEDYLDMPKVIYNKIWVSLPASSVKEYASAERKLLTELSSQGVFGRGSVYNQCRQIASGTMYSLDGGLVPIHTEKLEALKDLIDELYGNPLLVAYNYQHELATFKKHFPKASYINSDTHIRELAPTIEKWKAGKIKLLFCQSASMSHGVDGLQHGGCDICWYSPTDQPEVHDQLNARLYRQGQNSSQVRFHYILAQNTIEATILKRLETKGMTQSEFLSAMKKDIETR